MIPVCLLPENIGSKISDIPHSNIFANISPWARKLKEKIIKWDYFKKYSLNLHLILSL